MKLAYITGIVAGAIVMTGILYMYAQHKLDAPLAYGATPPSTVPQGGTGVGVIATGSIPYGGGSVLPGSLRIATTSGFSFATTTRSLSAPAWFSLNDLTLAYASSTNGATIFGLSAGGNVATTSLTATQVTAFGFKALAVNATGGLGNTGIGYQSLTAVTTGDDNTALGNSSGSLSTTGSRNTFLGSNSGTTGAGNGNIVIGAYVSNPATNSLLNIGNVLYGTNMYNNTVVGGAPQANGLLGVASTSQWAKFSIHANNGDTTRTLFAIGSSTSNATTTLFSIDNTGSTTVSNGITLTAGCFFYNGACLTGGGANVGGHYSMIDTSGVNPSAGNFGTTTSMVIPASFVQASSTITFNGGGTCTSNGGGCAIFLRKSDGTTIASATVASQANTVQQSFTFNGTVVFFGSVSSQKWQITHNGITTSSVSGSPAGDAGSDSGTTAIDFSGATTVVGVVGPSGGSTADPNLTNFSIVVNQ